MRRVEMAEAAASLERLVREASEGDGFIIAAGGRALVKVVAVEAGDAAGPVAGETAEEVARRRIGFMEGEFSIPDDFDTMVQAEIEEMFYGDRLPEIAPRT